jgi:hypothetical protein
MRLADREAMLGSRFIIVVLAIVVFVPVLVCMACAGSASPPPCTGNEVWPDPCYGVAAKTDAGQK